MHSIFFFTAIWDWIVRPILKFVEYLLNLLWIWGTNYNYLHDMNGRLLGSCRSLKTQQTFLSHSVN